MNQWQKLDAIVLLAIAAALLIVCAVVGHVKL
jgi:hypothetical protein